MPPQDAMTIIWHKKKQSKETKKERSKGKEKEGIH
jgi:hypothetical protein